MSKEIIKENKMGIMPVPKLLFSMATPIMISMIVQALYNIVDSIFVSQYSNDALTAVSLAFPIQNLMIAIASGTGVGINALLSRSLGEKNFRNANKCANNGITLAIIYAVVFVIFGLFASEPYFRMQLISTNDGSNIENIILEGKNYLCVCSVFSVGIFLQITFERLLQSTGKTMHTMIIQGSGAIINIILDPIFILKFGMGAKGAAIATIIGQCVAMLIGLFMNIKYNNEIKLELNQLKLERKTVANIYKVGFPSIIMISISSIMLLAMNKILIGFTPDAATALGVYFKLQSFIFMPVFGITSAMVPIIAYNFGAMKKERIIKTVKLSMLSACTIMLIGLLIFRLFATQLLSIFNPTESMAQIGPACLETISLSFIFAGFCIVASNTFQALGNGIFSLILSAARQLVVLVPVAYLLSLTRNLDYIWYAFPIAELMSVSCSVIFLIHINKKILSKLPDASEKSN